MKLSEMLVKAKVCLIMSQQKKRIAECNRIAEIITPQEFELYLEALGLTECLSEIEDNIKRNIIAGYFKQTLDIISKQEEQKLFHKQTVLEVMTEVKDIVERLKSEEIVSLLDEWLENNRIKSMYDLMPDLNIVTLAFWIKQYCEESPYVPLNTNIRRYLSTTFLSTTKKGKAK